MKYMKLLDVSFSYAGERNNNMKYTKYRNHEIHEIHEIKVPCSFHVFHVLSQFSPTLVGTRCISFEMKCIVYPQEWETTKIKHEIHEMSRA